MKTLAFHSYREDPEHTMERVRMDAAAYKQALSSLVIVCTDIVFIDRGLKVFHLVNRSIESMKGVWNFGGRMLVDEEPVESAQRCLAKETGLKLELKRFEQTDILFQYRCAFREQEPQGVGGHYLVFHFHVEPTHQELEYARKNLDANEYDVSFGIQQFDMERLKRDDVREPLHTIYSRIFSEQ